MKIAICSKQEARKFLLNTTATAACEGLLFARLWSRYGSLADPVTGEASWRRPWWWIRHSPHPSLGQPACQPTRQPVCFSVLLSVYLSKVPGSARPSFSPFFHLSILPSDSLSLSHLHTHAHKHWLIQDLNGSACLSARSSIRPSDSISSIQRRPVGLRVLHDPQNCIMVKIGGIKST